MRIFLAISLLAFGFKGFGQGCSDAGICTLDGLHAGDSRPDDNKTKYAVGLNGGYGLGEKEAFIWRIEPVLSAKFTGGTSVTLKVPFQSVSHVELRNYRGKFGLSDPTISVAQNFYEKNDWKLSVSLGFKYGIGDANEVENGPMAAQNSLGTHDLLFGIAALKEDWKFAVGYQKVLVNNNNSQDYFTKGLLPPIMPPLNQDLFSFNRSDDVMLRAERLFSNNKTKLSLGLLTVYHIGNDEYEYDGMTHEIEDSKGFTFNINFSGKREFREGLMLNWIVGVPIQARKARPDGLTRTALLGLGIAKTL